MAEEQGPKISGIQHVVRLRELLQKWQLIGLGPKDDERLDGGTTATTATVNGSSTSPTPGEVVVALGASEGTAAAAAGRKQQQNIRIRRRETMMCESGEESGGEQSPEPPPDVPKGYFAVYVGPEHRRFVIPTSYLGLPVFKVLLEKAEEEFGFDHQGGLTFPCEIETFKYILKCMERYQKGLIDDEGNPTDVESDEESGLHED